MAPVHEDSEKTPFHAKEHHDARRERTRHSAQETEQIIFTVNSMTGAIVKVEKIDSHGKRREFPKDETAALASKDTVHEIEVALDEAFEAGITSVLEPESDDDANGILPEEIELRHALLKGIIGSSIRRRLQRRLVQRLLLSKALAH